MLAQKVQESAGNLRYDNAPRIWTLCACAHGAEWLMKSTGNEGSDVAAIAESLQMPADDLDYLVQLAPADRDRLCALLQAAIDERRNVIVKALDDAGRHLPGPLRRKLSQRIQGD